MQFSRTLIPTAREAPRGISDPAVARLTRAGYLIPDQEKKTISLLPLGVLFWERLISEAKGLARVSGFQVVDFEDAKGDSPAMARKLVKSYRNLPLSFLGGDIRRWDGSGFAADVDSALEARDLFLEIASWVARTAGLTCYIGETEGGAERYVSLPCEKGSWYGRSGFVCSSCNWCGEDASPVPAPRIFRGDEAPVREVETPGADTIAELCRQLSIEPASTMKTMFYAAESGEKKEIVAVLARGDHQINDCKLSHVMGGAHVRFADPLEIREAVGDLAGYLGPVGLPEKIRVFADNHVEGCRSLVTGANKPGFHLLNVCWERDFRAGIVGDIVSVQEDFPCPFCGAPISPANLARVCVAGRETEASDIPFQTEGGKTGSACCWEGSLFITPLALALAKDGKIPSPFTPFDVNVVIASMQNDDAVSLGNMIAERLEERGLRVLLDDRNERAGVKFSDAELLGIPVTVVAGRESAESIVEVWQPDGSRGELPADAVIGKVLDWSR
jgi:prolyl-tRNA synthetase